MLTRLLLTYAAMGLAALLFTRQVAGPPDWRGPARGAWLAGWWVATAFGLLHADALPFAAGLQAALGPALWTATASLARPRGGAVWAVAQLGGLLCSVELGREAGPLLGVLTLGACVAGQWVATAMADRRHLGFRLASHWASFVGTFAVLLPCALAEREPAVLQIRPAALGLAMLLVLLALGLGTAATASFHRAGGTPEPLDPPPRLATEGIFSWLRHPIQLAEVAVVVAAALLLGRPFHGILHLVDGVVNDAV